jgi:hypothetical protein
MKIEKHGRRWHVLDDDGSPTGITRKTREKAEQAVIELFTPPPEQEEPSDWDGEA